MCKAVEELIEKKRKEDRQTFAQNLIDFGGITLEDIAKLSNLPLDEVQQLAAELPQ